MSNDTKSRILDIALKLFSEKGYDGTNIRELSAELGLSKAAFYKHYNSKEEIRDTLIDEVENYYNNHFGSTDNLPDIPKNTDELKALTMRMVEFTVNDERIVMTRKILLTEQFHNDRVRKLATEHFLNDTKAIFKYIFEQMIEKGVIKKVNTDFLSLSYTAPITSLIHLCDREPEMKPTIIQQIEEFTEHFIELYAEQRV